MCLSQCGILDAMLVNFLVLYNLSDTTLNELIYFFARKHSSIYYVCMYALPFANVKSLFEWCWYEKLKPSLSHRLILNDSNCVVSFDLCFVYSEVRFWECGSRNCA